MTCYNYGMSFLPSQKFTILSLLIVLAGSSTYAYFLYGNSIKDSETTQIYNEAKGRLNIILNPENTKKQDTDKDGVTDIDELLLNLDENPNSLDAKKVTDSARDAKLLEFGDTLTLLESIPDDKSDVIAKEIYIASLDKNLNNSDTSKLTGEKIKNLVTRGTYREQDLLIETQYSEPFENSLKKYFRFLLLNKDDIKNINLAINEKGEVDKNKLNYTRDKLKKAREYLLAVHYNKDYTQRFIEHINTITYLENILSVLVSGNQDAMSNYSAVSQFKGAISELISQYEKFK